METQVIEHGKHALAHDRAAQHPSQLQLRGEAKSSSNAAVKDHNVLSGGIIRDAKLVHFLPDGIVAEISSDQAVPLVRL